MKKKKKNREIENLPKKLGQIALGVLVRSIMLINVPIRNDGFKRPRHI